MEKLTLKKDEILRNKKEISGLFSDGNFLFFTSFKIVWLHKKHTGKYPVKTIFSVPKRNFKKANKRNLLRRRIKEAYRLNKHVLYKNLIGSNKTVNIMFIYKNKSILSYSLIEKEIRLIIKKLSLCCAK